VELLNFCQSQQQIDDAASTISGTSNKFIACFTSNGADGALSIVETNQFKALTHLSLSFRKANDEQLKRSLSEKLKEAKQHTAELGNAHRELAGRFE
jgi:spindle assembly abnormal protein 6